MPMNASRRILIAARRRIDFDFRFRRSFVTAASRHVTGD